MKMKASKKINLFQIALLLAGAAFLNSALASDSDANTDKNEKWDVANPPLDIRQIPIKVSSGTWMSLDLSPDGKTIAFDLLGDIYTMPVTGGKAVNISSGLPWEIQPRFSPDGSRLAFISDRKGGDNVWTMNVDGSERRAITAETFRLLNNPTWSADGRYIAARKHFTTSRSAGTGEIWLYHVLGGAGVQLRRERPHHGVCAHPRCADARRRRRRPGRGCRWRRRRARRANCRGGGGRKRAVSSGRAPRAGGDVRERATRPPAATSTLRERARIRARRRTTPGRRRRARLDAAAGSAETP